MNNISELLDLFSRLDSFLRKNGGKNFLPGVSSIRRILLSQNEGDASECMDDVRSIFKSMMGGAGTLGDFVVFNEDEKERIILNKKLDELLKSICKMLNDS